MKVKFKVRCCNGDAERDLELPGHYVVCHGCGGKGSHVNRAIDGNGISPEEFAEDPDFAEAYFSGRYDVPCEDCGGERVLAEVDLDRLPKKLRERVQDQIQAEAEYKAEKAHHAACLERGIHY